MKKTLLGASVIAMTSAQAGVANAAEWDLDWGGFFNAWAVYSSEDEAAGVDPDGFDILTNAEIIFTPSITLDNGLTFGAKVEMEAEADGSTQSGVIDESVMFVRGSFGTVELGAEDSAFGRMGVCSPTNGPAGVCSGTLTGTFLGNPDNGRSYGAFDGPAGGGGYAGQLAGDAVRINYFSPRFAGFQLGASYARGTSKDDRNFEDRAAGRHDVISLGANYTNSFGAFDLTLAGTYETASDVAGEDPEQFHLGASFGFSGITIGGGYAHYEDDNDETDFFDIGVGYSTGPWGVSLGYSLTDHDLAAGDVETQQVAINGSYDLGPGVTAVAFGGWADRDNAGGGDFDGFVVGTGFNLAF